MELGALLVMTNPLLEAFGNAETNLNKNSSRFGKFTQIHVSKNGAILGASIQTYLLESTRVITHAEKNCNYHIFYQMILGLPSSERAKCKLEGDPNKYPYLRNATGKATARRGADANEFNTSLAVLEKVGVPSALVQSLWETISGLLMLGNITYNENPNGDASVSDLKALETASQLLGCHQALLTQGLTSRTMKLKGSEMQIPLKLDEAGSSRDALAKAVYGKLFNWIVTQINGALIDKTMDLTDTGFLGILDIYGFENFDKNSLEQLLINFTNEQLHQHFAISLFKTEQEIYAAEGIVWPGIEWEDNTACLEMISGKGPSVFNQVTEHSRLPKATDEDMTEKLLNDHRKNTYMQPPKMGGKGRGGVARLTAKEAFVITHFAGEVMYQTSGWLKKNTDNLHEDLQLCMSSSTSPILAQLFSIGTINAITGGARGGSKRAGFVVDKYQRQLEELMRTLKATSSHFVRCIKPNHEQVPHKLNKWLVLDQLRNSGMVDAVRLLSAGYSVRIPFSTLEESFKPMCPAKFQKLPAAEFATTLLTALELTRTDFLLGLTKAFFKSSKLAFVDSLMDGSRKLDATFFKRMSRVLALWRFRRAIAAVRCTIFLEAKMRRLRALRQLRNSAMVAAAVGRSWMRRAKEIRYGNAVMTMQKSARGMNGRNERKRRTKAILNIQSGARGMTARRELKALMVSAAEAKKARVKEERERKIRERREAMEERDRRETEKRDAGGLSSGSHTVRVDRMTMGAQSAATTGLKHTYSGGVGRRTKDERMQERRETRAVKLAQERGEDPEAAVKAVQKAHAEGNVEELLKLDRQHGIEPQDDDAMSDGSDMIIQDSDDEEEQQRMLAGVPSGDPEGGDSARGIRNPKDLLAATAAIDYKSAGGRGIQGLGLNGSDEETLYTAGGGAAGKHLSKMSRLKAQAMGSMTPRSGFFNSKRMPSTGAKLLLTKTAKGSLVTGSMVRVRKSYDASWTDRYAVVVGDALLVFMLSTQPELPLGLRLWPSQVISLNTSTLGSISKVDIKKDATFSFNAQVSAFGGIMLQADDIETMQRFAITMLLGVSNVKRARSEAKLRIAQQLLHEKKLSLLKTQHMIDLLHKSQEMFFEAGSGQFDDCNAVCMHSGTMRQSLIDVTPFMPVSDFICEYCACVIIPEEQAAASTEGLEAKLEEFKGQLKREQSKKLSLDDETLDVARDVRVLRQRRKLAEEEAAAGWSKVETVIKSRQQMEASVAEQRVQEEVQAMSAGAIAELKAAMQEQLATAQRERDKLRDQLQVRQARLAGFGADVDPEEELRQLKTNQRKMSFNKRSKSAVAAVDQRADSFGKKPSGLTRVLSFGRSKKKEDPPVATSNGGDLAKKETVGGTIVRRMSFGRKKS